ncbi:hypothetical protein RMCBS344292_12881 [Rhizopus microsporus]|nr:hypothetical protein RMCBS344292_12881 [Rhizopus microsporus]
MYSKRYLCEGLFFIKSKHNGSILEALSGCISDGIPIIVDEEDFQKGFNQFWSYDNGYFVNAKRSKVIAVYDGPIKPKADIV